MTASRTFRLVLGAATISLFATAASAYVGPGAGLTAIGTVLALVAAAVLAIAGFVWYPVKRLLGRRRAPASVETGGTARRDEGARR